jgi:hypothetical protein
MTIREIPQRKDPMTTDNTPKTCPNCGRFVAANSVCEPCRAGAQVGTFSGAVSLLFGSTTSAPPAPAPRTKTIAEILRGE